MLKRFAILLFVSVFMVSNLPGQTEQELLGLQKKLMAHTQELPPDLGQKRLPEGYVAKAEVAFDTAQEILSKHIHEEFRVWTLKRKAAALIPLAYEKTVRYLPELIRVVDELDGVKTCEVIMAEAEKHVLLISSSVAVQPIEDESGRKTNVAVKPLAERMVFYAKENPGPESEFILRFFLQKLDEPTPRREIREKRLAEAIPVIADYYAGLNDEKSRAFADRLRSTQRRLELPGNSMLLTGYSLNGQLFDMASIKDKVVLVQFWGTWCQPCLHEMPLLIELYDKFRSRGFEIIGVNTAVKDDKQPQTVKRFLDTMSFAGGKKITWPVLHEGLAQANKMEPITYYYDIEELPVLVLIGRNGKVIAVNPSPVLLETMIQDALVSLSLDDLTDEERTRAEAARKQQDEELDRQIKRELDAIREK